MVHSAPTAARRDLPRRTAGLAAAGLIRLIERHTDTHGMLDVARLDELVPDLAERTTWACGPVGLLDALRGALGARRLAERLHTERFRPDGSSSPATAAPSRSPTGTTRRRRRRHADPGRRRGGRGADAARAAAWASASAACCRCARAPSATCATARSPPPPKPGDGVLIQTCVSAAAGACDIDH